VAWVASHGDGKGFAPSFEFLRKRLEILGKCGIKAGIVAK
jgi:hypothetical protein